MRNEASWRPSKYIRRGNHWISNNDPHEVGTGSILISNIIARTYDKHINNYASGHLLDLGCGKVPLYGIYRNAVDNITCADWIDREHVDIVTNLAQPLPFPDSAFDTIIMSDVLEHVPNPDLVWREMTRTLAPGGHILLNVPFFYWIHEHPHDFYRYTNFALLRFVSINNLELKHLEAIGGIMETWTDLHAKIMTKIPFIGKPLAILLQSSINLFNRCRTGQFIAEKSARHFPLGYFIVAQKPHSHQTNSL